MNFILRSGSADPTPLLTLSEAELTELKVALKGSDAAASLDPIINELIASRRARRMEAHPSKDPEPGTGTRGRVLGVIALVALAALAAWMKFRS